ncbi:MAG: hypothetical protein JXQ95_06895 [Alteromonas stellipolaris]|uniref:hypothetical protein n=1 Tax=Alteromonas stellipolaris TaxID=233316 RepID=UPI003B8C0C01
MNHEKHFTSLAEKIFNWLKISSIEDAATYKNDLTKLGKMAGYLSYFLIGIGVLAIVSNVGFVGLIITLLGIYVYFFNTKAFPVLSSLVKQKMDDYEQQQNDAVEPAPEASA